MSFFKKSIVLILCSQFIFLSNSFCAPKKVKAYGRDKTHQHQAKAEEKALSTDGTRPPGLKKEPYGLKKKGKTPKGWKKGVKKGWKK